MTKTAIVAGGGIAGTVAAIALRRAGFTPLVHEAYPADADQRGAFLTVAVNGLTALRALDLDPADLLAAGYPTPRVALGTGSGRPLADLPLGGPTADGTITTTIKRADLYTALRAAATREGVPIRYGKRLVTLTEDAHGVTAGFADGTSVTADLLVGADGLNSRARTLLDPAAPAPRYLGLLNAGGFTTEPIAADLDRTPGLIRMAFGRRCFFGWSVAPDGSVWWFANPPSKRPHTGFTPAQWRSYLLDLFAGDAIPAAAIIRATGEVLGPWNTFDLPRVRVWRSRRAVLLGDAAHAVAPSSGQGASMAIEDAVTLGRCLAALEVPEALAAYEGLRRARVEKVVAFGRRNSSGKTAGPVGAWIRDRATPPLMRMLYRKGDPQAWIFDHRLS
ncbi:MAG TPA: NAD(P)/FAD-dependent oxidoreductase [Actinoplanes sp.]|nr:NAD(P)/FAD-dependent oxidoreductase [Actinoplanes sp.]